MTKEELATKIANAILEYENTHDGKVESIEIDRTSHASAFQIRVDCQITEYSRAIVFGIGKSKQSDLSDFVISNE